jgi:peptidoglycan-N-acetylglucosamine deacetylase
MIISGTLGVLLAGCVAHGAFHRNSPVFGRVRSRVAGGTGTPGVALTFDDGPNAEATPRILEALRARGVRATFFLLGRHVERYPQIARQIAEDGHAIGNHGFHHRKLHLKSPAYVRDDLERGARAIEAATGVRPRWFRAPHGFRSPWVNDVARSLGEEVVGWSLGVWDSDRPGVDTIVRRAVDGTRGGSILLLHDGDGYDVEGDRLQTAAAVPLIVDALASRGLRFVTLDGT